MQGAGINTPLKEVRLLCAHILKCSYESVYFSPPSVLTQKQVKSLEDLITRRSKLEPLAKILGFKEFLGNSFFTNEHTLDPRPESETFFEAFTEFFSSPFADFTALELGIGTGCLLLSFLLKHPNAKGIGIDKSYKALETAHKNTTLHGLLDRCLLVQADALADIPIKQVDLIISNPPYIGDNEPLDKSTLFDPKEALYAAMDGYLFYNVFAQTLKKHLKTNGYLVIEIGHKQAKKVISIFLKNSWHHKKSFCDLLGIERILVFQK